MSHDPHEPAHDHHHEPVDIPSVKPRITLGGRLRAYFFAGILVTAPAAITFYVAWLIIGFIDQQVTSLLPSRYNPNDILPFSIPGLGLVILIVVLTMIGAFTAGFVGRMAVRLSEGMLARMPVIRSLYGAVKQIFETVLATQSTAFRQVVLVEYPRRGIWALGFVSGVTKGEVQNLTEDEVINVFLPTTPNPTSGFLLFVPRRDLVVLNMTVEDGIKMVVSGGIVTPPDPRPPEESKVPLVRSNELEQPPAVPEDRQPVA
ncbi:MAG: DUF502 domain-containing protein [Caenispirillum bisanense]|nr:DUF502 domain-containing protein [Caenispirillum bisanense]MCA1971529.1 DUF502 domain-containing protein [Caenispirillum sp.]